MTRLRLLALALVALLLAVESDAAARFGRSQGPGRVDMSLAWRAGAAGPGQTLTLGVIMDIAEGWHLQAGEGSGDDRPPYIATTIELTLPEGWTSGNVTWPAAHDFTLGSGKFAEDLAGYEGRVLAAVTVTVPADAAPGPHPIGVTLGYQACDDSVCEMPTSVTGRTRLDFTGRGSAETDPPAAIENLFAATLDRAGADAGPGGAAAGPGERLRIAELAWYEGRLVPGRDATLGVVLDVAPAWHILAGEGSGDERPPYRATTVEVALPEGWTAGAVLWPPAHAFSLGSGMYAEELAGYEGRLLAAVVVRIPDGAAPGEHPIRVTVGFQACDDAVCEEPATARATGTAVVASEAEPGAGAGALSRGLADRFAETLRREADGAEAPGAIGVEGDSDGDDAAALDVKALKHAKWWLALALIWAAMGWMAVRTVRLAGWMLTAIVLVVAAGVMYGSLSFVRVITKGHAWVPYTTAAFDGARADGKTVLIKFTADWCANCQVNERLILGDEAALAELARPDVVAFKVDFTGAHPEGDAKKEELGGGGIPLIAVYVPGRDEPAVIRGQLVSAEPVINALRGEIAERSDDEVVFDFLNWQFTVSKDATLLILALALLAGFFMNFTPCVLPVIPLKILSLQAHAKDPARCFGLGLVFGLGIVALYAGLGVLMAGIVASIGRMDWSEPFQFWWVTGPIGLIVGFMALGLLGLFSLRLPQFLYMFNPQGDSLKGSFFMGVFTAILSTPCTGPLLGAAIVWVAFQPPAIAFLTLVVMGAGMAFPYVLLTARPAWLERLPRTGPGSELVKQVMGLLLLAVALYFLGTAVAALAA